MRYIAAATHGVPSPDEIADKLEKLRGLGIEYVLLNGGGLVIDQASDSLRRFAREVVPAFADAAKVSAAE